MFQVAAWVLLLGSGLQAQQLVMHPWEIGTCRLAPPSSQCWLIGQMYTSTYVRSDRQWPWVRFIVNGKLETMLVCPSLMMIEDNMRNLICSRIQLPQVYL